MAVKLHFIPKDEIPYVWTALIPFVDRFLEESQGESTAATMLQHLCSGEYQCWVVMDYEEIKAVCITKIDTWASYKALHILGLTGGEWISWAKLHHELEIFAKRVGCDRITMWGRKGWKRLFDKSDFKGQNGEKYEHMYDVLHMKLNMEEDKNEKT